MSKTIYIILVSFLIFFLNGFAQLTQKLEFWDFDNDVAGESFSTDNTGITNSGSNASVWNFGGPAASMRTDGIGNFEISGHDGQTYRSLDGYAAGTYATGKYRIELNLSSWNLDSTTNGLLGLEIVNTNNSRQALISVGVNNGAGQIQMSVPSPSTNNPSGFAFGSQAINTTSSSGIEIALEFDYDADTAEYIVDGSTIRTINDFGGDHIGQLKIFTNNNWSTNSSILIDEIGLLQVIPEPSTYALFSGLVAITLAIRSRRLNFKV